MPDIIVNNAGIVVRARLDETSEDEWDDVVDANLKGTFNVTRVFLPQMRARGSGRIINIASISGRQGTPRLAAYCAAKHGVVGLTRALAEETREAGIQVNAICPGSVDTDMLAGSGFPAAHERATTSPAWRSGSPAAHPLRSPARASTCSADARCDDSAAARLTRSPAALAAAADLPAAAVQLFPHALLPLHVFEPRYRDMVRDAWPASASSPSPRSSRASRPTITAARRCARSSASARSSATSRSATGAPTSSCAASRARASITSCRPTRAYRLVDAASARRRATAGFDDAAAREHPAAARRSARAQAALGRRDPARAGALAARARRAGRRPERRAGDRSRRSPVAAGDARRRCTRRSRRAARSLPSSRDSPAATGPSN